MEKNTTPAHGRLAQGLEIAVETWSELGTEGQGPTGEQLASALEGV
jgi:hypothetical protein